MWIIILTLSILSLLRFFLPLDLSGGHTAEMLRLLEDLNEKAYTPIVFVLAESDATSLNTFNSSIHKEKWSNHRFVKIPRSREVRVIVKMLHAQASHSPIIPCKVGQSWFSSFFTSIYALIFSFYLVWKENPDLIISNGVSKHIQIV